MSVIQEREYLVRRCEESRAQAKAARDSTIARIHDDLAERYQRRIIQLRVADQEPN